MRYFCLIFLFLLTGCGPAKKLDTSNIRFQCLASQSSCTVSTESGQFEVLFSQDKVLTEVPFSIRLSSSTIGSINNISGFLEGKDMFMGKVPVFFELDSNGEYFVAETLLGSCSEEKMIWRLWLTINGRQEQQNLDFEQTFFIDFESTRH